MVGNGVTQGFFSSDGTVTLTDVDIRIPQKTIHTFTGPKAPVQT